MEEDLASLTVFAIVFFIGLVTRLAFSMMDDRYWFIKCQKELLSSLSATWEEVYYKREYFLIHKHHGAVWYFLVLVLQNMITNRTYKIGDGMQNPLRTIREYHVRGRTWWIMGAIVIVAQMTWAAALSFKWAKWVHQFGFSDDHNMIFNSKQCAHQHENTPHTIASTLAIELFVSLLDTWAHLARRAIWTKNCLHKFVLELIHVAAMSATIVISAPLTGGFFNPAQALSHMLNCDGHMDHGYMVIVYLIMPFIATLIAILLKDMFVKRLANAYVRLNADPDPEEKESPEKQRIV